MSIMTRRALTAAAMLCGFTLIAAAPPEAIRVHLKDGRLLEARACRIEAETALLEMGDGGTIGFPADRVARIEPVEIASDVSEMPVEIVPVPAPVVLAQPSPSLPAPAQPDSSQPVTIDSLIRQAARTHGIDEALLAAVVAVESGYRTRAVSGKGAEGLMQLMPATARELEVTDPFDPAQNIDAGAKYLRQLLDQHGDSYVNALAAYNAGMGRVARYKGMPPYRETATYIRRVLNRMQERTRASKDSSGGSR